MIKTCYKCKENKTVFAVNKYNSYYCRECLLIILKEISILDLRKLGLTLERRKN